MKKININLTLNKDEFKEKLGLKDGMTPVKGVDYFDGTDAVVDEEAIVQSVLDKIPPYLPGKDAVVNEDEIIKSLLKTLKKKRILDVSYIKGLEGFSKDGINYRFEELMHGGGGTSAGSITYSVDLSSQCDGVNKVFTVPTNTNFVLLTGTDAPIIYKLNTDYTGSSTTTLTMTSQVNAPSLGATLILTYIV